LVLPVVGGMYARNPLGEHVFCDKCHKSF
jgi:hypothetical protein